MWIILIIIIACLFMYLIRKRRKLCALNNIHCMITGGSSGIGLALAIQVARHGGNVTIIARSKENLATAKDLIVAEFKNNEQKILTFSADITKHEEVLKDIVKEAEKVSGCISLLVNCAGSSVCAPFLETTSEDFSKMLNVNYFGSVYMTRAVLPSMMHQKCGTVVFVSSLAGLMGIFGYTAYSASKFALLGLAESLQMEVKPYNINITVAFPPDTDTPGFAEEIKNKPIETIQISQSAGLFSAEKVAETILKDSVNKKFMSTVGFDGNILATLCSGMTPINSSFELVMQVMTMGLFRLASVFILFQFDKIIKRCATERESFQKKELKKES